MVVVVDYEKYMSFLRVLNEVGSHSFSYPTWSSSLPYVLALNPGVAALERKIGYYASAGEWDCRMFPL